MFKKSVHFTQNLNIKSTILVCVQSVAYESYIIIEILKMITIFVEFNDQRLSDYQQDCYIMFYHIVGIH